MNEQQLADLFSEQIDRLVEGDASATASDVNDLQELLQLGHQISNTHFQASAAAQATFQSLLAGWFGLANGGSPMTILGLSKAWFISIITVVVGAGFVAVTVANIFIFGGEEVVVVPTVESAVTPEAPTTAEPTEMPTSEAPDTDSPDASPTGEPETSPTGQAPSLIFVSNLGAPSLCGGAYTAQSALVNYGGLPITDAALAWEVIEGMEFVDQVNIDSDSLEAALGEDNAAATDTVALPDADASAASLINDAALAYSNYANFSPISTEQKVKLDVKVKVKDGWWGKPDGTKIKVKLSVKNKVKFNQGKQEYKLDYKYKYEGKYNDPSPNQIITIVKEGAQWITLSGVAQPYNDQSWLVDGTIVVIDGCTGLPLNLVAGAYVNVIGFLQPNGTFIAINIININNDVTIINFDSGVPLGGDDSDSGDDGNDGGGGGGGCCKKGGSKKGGSKKGGS